MSKAKQRAGNKPRRHGYGDPFAQFRLMRKLQPFTQSELLKLNLTPRMAWQAMRTGQSNDNAAALSRPSSTPHSSAARPSTPTWSASANRPSRRSGASSNATCRPAPAPLTHQDIEDIEPVIDLHEQLLELSTPLEMERALLEVLRRAAAGETL